MTTPNHVYGCVPNVRFVSLLALAIGLAVLLGAPGLVLPAAAQADFGYGSSGPGTAVSGGSWRHPEGYFAINLPSGFAKLHDDPGYAFTIFGPADASELLFVVNVPGASLPLEIVADHVPDVLQLLGPFRMSGGFRSDPTAGPGVYAADAFAANGVFARVYLKQSGQMTLITIVVVESQPAFQRRASMYGATVQSLHSTYIILDASDGHRELPGRWERASSSTTDDLNFVGGRTTYTFYVDGTAERFEVTMISIPGFGSSRSEKTIGGAYIALGDIMFLYWYEDQGVMIEIVSWHVNRDGLYLDEVVHHRVSP